MKKFLFILSINLFIFGGLLAQNTYEYTYDANGNRIVRQIITLKQVSADIDDSVLDDNSLVYSKGELKIYPNPVSVSLTIDMEGSPDYCFNYRIIDLHGKIIKTGKTESGSTNVDMSAFPNGSYILHITGDGSQSEWKIIKK